MAPAKSGERDMFFSLMFTMCVGNSPCTEHKINHTYGTLEECQAALVRDKATADLDASKQKVKDITYSFACKATIWQ